MDVCTLNNGAQKKIVFGPAGEFMSWDNLEVAAPVAAPDMMISKA